MGLDKGGGGVDVHGLGVSEELLEVGGRVESILHAPAVAGLSDLLSLTDGLNWTELECQVNCWINCLLPLRQRQQRYCQDPHSSLCTSTSASTTISRASLSGQSLLK